MKKNVLFLCPGNSCQSQMAEGFLKHFSGDKYNVYSAGINADKINEYAIKVMKEIGIDISNHKSKSIEELSNKSFDIIITVSDTNEKYLPYIPDWVERIHWELIDPSEALSSQENLLDAFRELRDNIQDKIKRHF